ncbi:MAG TPA: hypothetical protein VER17_19170 [Tepidisphaeraceae bacterium]|nr:hypothetical protein [Tepidisphaeraceae bacterium]
MSESPLLRDYIYLDTDRARSIAAQLRIGGGDGGGGADVDASDRAVREAMVSQLEPALVARGNVAQVDASFDFTKWTPDGFRDGQFVRATGVVRLMDFQWLSEALSGLPAVLKRMSKLEMEALRNSEEGKRLSKTELQRRSQENQVAIARVEEMKADELGDVVTKLYGNVVRVKVRPSPEQPNAVLVGSAYGAYFYDSPAALSQKYGIEIDAGWTVLGQLNVPNPAAQAHPIPTGNRMEDSFEQIALLMNNAFRMSSAPAFPAVSFTPIAIYRTSR